MNDPLGNRVEAWSAGDQQSRGFRAVNLQRRCGLAFFRHAGFLAPIAADFEGGDVYLKSILDEIESCARNDMSRTHFRYLLLRSIAGWRSIKSLERALQAVGSDSVDRSS